MFNNNLLMAGAAATSASITSVGNSALFKSASSQYLSRTPDTNGNNKIGTFSTWFYHMPTGADQTLFAATAGAADIFQLYIDSNDDIILYNYSSGYDWQYVTDMKFRDGGWIHFCCGIDTSDAASTNRVILEINGVRVTDFSTASAPSLNFANDFNTASNPMRVASYDGSNNMGNNYMAESVWIDGTRYSASDFGQFDSSGLYWTPKTSSEIQGLTFGTNGFYLANKVTDAPQLDFQDGDDNTVVLSQYYSLLHFDGSDASTTLTDSSSFASNWTANGDAQLDTAQSKFGTASLLLDGTGDYASHASLATVGTQNFTIDFWVRRNGSNTDNALLTWGDSGADTGLRILTSTANKLIVSTGNSAIIGTGDHSTSLPDGTWAHVELVRSGSTLYLFQDGTLLSSKSFSYNLTSTSAWWIGDDVVSSSPGNFNGWIDEVRIVIGYAAHTSGFTAPTSAYSDPPTANNFTNNNSVTTDVNSPTNISGLINQNNPNVATLSNGNKTVTSTGSGDQTNGVCILPCTGKVYFEFEYSVVGTHPGAGIVETSQASAFDDYVGGGSTSWGWYFTGGDLYNGGSAVETTPSTLAVNTRGCIAFDTASGKFWTGQLSGSTVTWDNSGNPASGSNPITSSISTSKTWSVVVSGRNSCSISLYTTSTDFEISALPSGFTAIDTTNIAEDTTRTAHDIDKYFKTVLYEGNGTTQRVGNFQPFGNSFTVGNGALFNDDNSEYLSKTFSGAGNQKKWTWSCWVKRGVTGVIKNIIRTANGNDTAIQFLADGTLQFYTWSGSAYLTNLITSARYEDSSQWMHIVVKYDSTPSTPSSSSIAIYINGVTATLGTATYPSQNSDSGWNGTGAQYIGGEHDSTNYYYDGYMAEVVFIDNSALDADSFGQTDTTTNRWIPKDVSGLTFGTNGFYLDFADSGNVGDDESGNANDWTNNNTVTQTTDSPTVNYSVLDDAYKYSAYTDGNLTMSGYASSSSNVSTIGVSSGKWYCELTCGSTVGSPMLGVVPFDQRNTGQYPGQSANGIGWDGGTLYRNNATLISSYGSAFSNGEVNAIMLDLDNNQVTFRQANTAKATVDLNTPQGTTYYFYFRNGGASSANNATVNFGASDFTYSIPTGYSKLAQDNITSSDQFISALSWIKNRDATDNQMWFDRVRGATKDLHSNATAIEVTNVNTLQSFLAGGVQVGDDAEVNTASESFVLWNWMMEATGSGSSYTGGDINTTALVDTTLGMAVGTYSGSNSNQTIQTGLTNPKMVIIKRLNDTYNWAVWHEALTDDYSLFLNTASTEADNNYFDTSENTSTLFYLKGNSNATSISGGNFVYLAFADSQFISVGSFTGNESTNGPFVPTINSAGVPIQPAWIMIKNTVQARSWIMWDKVRSPYNVSENILEADTTTAEQTGSTFYIDIDTGGFKIRGSHEMLNGAETMIYLAMGTPIIDTDGRILAGR